MTRLDPAILARHHRRNRLQTIGVLAGIGAWMALVGWLLAGVPGVVWALAGTGLLLLIQPVRSPLVLRAMFGARLLNPAEAPGLSRLVAGLADRAGLSRVPPLMLIPRSEMVALSIGNGSDAVVAVSGGLVAELPPRELAAVLAHEISHLRHGDLRILRLAEAAGRLTRFLALFGVLSTVLYLPAALALGVGTPPPLALLLLVAAPAASDLLTLKLSRTREFEADFGAAELTGDPEGLILALRHIERLQGNGWESLMRGPSWLALIRTHPTTAQRLARLEELAPPPRPNWTLPTDVLLLPGLHRPAARERRRWPRGPWG